MAEFIFMLTQNDVTRSDALQAYESVREVEGLRFVGFKNVGLDVESYRALVKAIHDDHRSAFLEVVSDTEQASLESTKLGLALGVDYLIGTFPEYVRSTLKWIKGEPIKFMPYAGTVFDHPCRLKGTVDEIREHAETLEAEGVDGLNILAYRHISLDGEAIAQAVITGVSIPVIVAGSITSENQVTRMSEIGVWAFTVGGAVFERRFVPGGSLAENIRRIFEVA